LIGLGADIFDSHYSYGTNVNWTRGHQGFADNFTLS